MMTLLSQLDIRFKESSPESAIFLSLSDCFVTVNEEVRTFGAIREARKWTVKRTN